MSKKRTAPVSGKGALELCEVARLGIKIGEMMLAFDGAELRLREEKDERMREVGENIVDDLRCWQNTMIDLATYQRAGSLAGALAPRSDR